MDETEFRRQTKILALRIIALVEELPRTRVSEVIGKQLLRSGTSIGANYRAACQARSVAKLCIVEEEADESIYWCELLDESGTVPSQKTSPIVAETREILAMTIASKKTLAKRLHPAPPASRKIGN